MREGSVRGNTFTLVVNCDEYPTGGCAKEMCKALLSKLSRVRTTHASSHKFEQVALVDAASFHVVVAIRSLGGGVLLVW